MRRTILQTVMIAGLALFSFSIAQAQGAGTYRAEVPFDFSVGNKEYAAGVYLIEVRGSEQKFVVLRDSNGRNPYAARTSPGDDAKDHRAALDFIRIGENYFLAAIRASNIISTFPKPDIAERLAQNKNRRTVTLALTKPK